MYQEFFGLSQRPFPSVPSLAGYQETESHRLALETILRCIRRDEGIATLIAPAGLGKSTVAMRLQVELEGEFEVVRLNSGHCGSRRALLQAITYELGLPYRGLDEGELRIQFAEHVERLDHRRVQGIVLLVDEADLLPIRLLEELRLLTNFTHKQRSRVSVVLLGNLALEERLASPYLVSFNQRVGARAYLQSLNGEETAAYVRKQMKSAGARRTVFDESAAEQIAAKSQGIPRVINQICDHSLLLACLGETATIDAEGIDEAWAELQRLPSPKRRLRTDAAHSSDSLIEFGSLEDSGLETGNDFPSVVRFGERQESMAEADDEFVAERQTPEIELTFQNATNPFDEPFAKEEVVIDRFASLGDGIAAGIRRVTSPRNSEIAAFLVDSGEAHQAQVEVVQPQYAASEAMIVSRDFSTAPTGFSDTDDRDIIVIDSGDKNSSGEAAHPKMPAPSRRTYRQLFTQLRREHA